MKQELSIAVGLAVEAAELASAGQEGIRTERKSDSTPVTAADRAVDHLLRNGLAAIFPADGMLSEETEDDASRLEKERVWIIDPIDGTKGFIEQGEEWAIHIGLAVAGVLRIGVVALPGRDELLAGAIGYGAWRIRGDRWEPLRVPERPARTALASRRFAGMHDSPLPDLDGYDRRHCHSVGYKVGLMLAGDASVYVHPQAIYEWDVAAPAAVLLAAGGYARDCCGRPFVFNQEHPRCQGLVFCCNGEEDAIAARLVYTPG